MDGLQGSFPHSFRRQPEGPAQGRLTVGSEPGLDHPGLGGGDQGGPAPAAGGGGLARQGRGRALPDFPLPDGVAEGEHGPGFWLKKPFLALGNQKETPMIVGPGFDSHVLTRRNVGHVETHRFTSFGTIPF